jgi:serine/threonine protein kinase
VRSTGDAETFRLGLKSFVNEAPLLAQFDHPALVKVYPFWEANHTAYMVMPFYEGLTLQRAFAERSDRPDEAALRGLIDPLLDALTILHRSNCFHRDISPDNILLTARAAQCCSISGRRAASLAMLRRN